MNQLTRLSFFLFFFSLSFTLVQAQSQRATLNAGIGVLPTFAKDKSKNIVLPLILNFDYRLGQRFSLGLYAGYSVSETDRQVINDGHIAQWRNRFSVIGLRAAAHTTKWEKWDVYGGMTVGYSRAQIDILEGDEEMITEHKGIKPDSGKFTMSGFVGTRYHLTDKIGLYSELGFGISILTAGISYRF